MQKNKSQSTGTVHLEKVTMIRQLAAGIAREIRNPMAVIKTMLFAMRTDIAPEDPRCVDFDVLNKEVDRMERSIQRFIDYTWPPEPIFAPVSLSQIVTDAMGKFVHKAQNQGVHVETHVDLDVIILADQMQIEQVFVNLAFNALQAMPEGGKLSIAANAENVFVNLALEALPATIDRTEPGIKGDGGRTARGSDEKEGANTVGVEVADTGEGIPGFYRSRL
jgi:signal transduction histidine kinase